MTEVTIQLPVGDITTRFSGKSTEDKLRIIELGMNLYEKGQDTYQVWNNKEWSDRLDTLQKEVEREKVRFDNQRTEMTDAITKQQSDKYTARIESMSKHIEMLEKHNQGLMEKLTNHYDTTETKVNERIGQASAVYQRQIDDLQGRLDQSREAYEGMLGRTSNSAFKGQDGEILIQKQVTMMFPKAELEDTTQQPGRGDLIFKDDNMTMMIEIKNYTKNVQKSEIDKFYRDLERETNNDIQCAIFVSLNTGICCRDDFAFEVVNKKPVFFIHNVKESVVSIKLAVNLFRNILSSNDLDMSNKNVICSLRNVAAAIKRNFTKQKKAIDKHHSDQMETICSLENNIIELYKVMKVKF